MALKKCPICELNYLRGNETMCRVCAAERSHRHEPEQEEEILCSECGEQPAMKGQELCEECFKEQRRQAELELHADRVREEEMEEPLEDDISKDSGDE